MDMMPQNPVSHISMSAMFFRVLVSAERKKKKRTIELSDKISGMQSSYKREMASFLRQKSRLLVLPYSACQPLLSYFVQCCSLTTYPHPLPAASRPWAAALRRSVVAT
jgi:hypothetical protein